MSSSQEKVLEMVARGEISAEQADSLLGAMRHERSRLRKLLLHPLDAMTTEQALILSSIAACAGLALGAAGVRFDGALDMHIGPHAVRLGLRAVDLVVAWPLPAFLFWLGARLRDKPVRVIDFLAAVGVARVPSVVCAGLLALMPGAHRAADPVQYAHEHPAQIAIIAVVALGFVAWQIALLYNGAKTASGLSDWKSRLAFVGLLIAAEILSKVVLQLAAPLVSI
jgi:hypothetical protein